MTPNPITLNHNSSADTTDSDDEDRIEYTVRHGYFTDDDDLVDSDDDEDDDEHVEEDEEVEDASLGSWEHVNHFDPRDKDIDPSESASRSHQPAPSARAYSAGKQPIGRGKPPQRVPKVPDPPPGSPPLARARTRERPRRPRSVANVDALEDDYPGGYGHPNQMPYHPAQQWSGVGHYPAAPSIVSGGGYEPGGFALSQYSRGDPFSSYGQSGANPFTQPPDEYFNTRRNRSSMPQPPPGGEMMRYGGYSPYGQYGGYPPPGFPYPGYPGYGAPPLHSPSPHASKKSTPAPPGEGGAGAEKENPEVKAIKEMLLAQEKRETDKAIAKAKATLEAKKSADDASKKKEEDKLEALQKLIIEHNKQQLEREKKQLEKMEAELKAKAAMEVKAAEAKKAAEEKSKELKAAAEKAKLDAEKEAAKKAAEEKAKHDKEIEEAKKKAAELEEGKKKAEAEAAKLRPGDDMLKAPIKFKDAVGRKFSFPWHLCKTWKGMEALINQAFLHVDVIGRHVHEGHYDLVGPDGEIILPQVYESMVKPDWAITMHMWPMPEPPKPPQGQPEPPPPMAMPPQVIDPRTGRPKKDKHGKGRAKDGMGPPGPPGPPPPPMGMPGMFPPPPPPPGMAGIPPPPMPPGMMMGGGLPHPPPAVAGMMAAMGPPGALPPEKTKKKKKAHPTGFLMWTAGGPSRNQSLKSEKKPESSSAAKRASATASSSTTKVTKVKVVEHRPSAPNGESIPRPSAPNGKAENAGAKAAEECIVM